MAIAASEGLLFPVTAIPEEEYATLVGLYGARVLADGRLGALVELEEMGERFLIFLVFAERNGRLLIDGFTETLL